MQLLTAVVGSKLHGNARPDSDTDLHGIHVDATMDLVGVYPKPHPVKVDQSNPDIDFTSWEVGHFANMALQGELNCLEVLFAREYHELSLEGERLLANRYAFVSQRIRPKWVGWCTGMAKRVGKGQGRARTELGRTKEAFHCFRIGEMLKYTWTTGRINPTVDDPQRWWKLAELTVNMDDSGQVLGNFVDRVVDFTKNHDTVLPEDPDLESVQAYLTELRSVNFR